MGRLRQVGLPGLRVSAESCPGRGSASLCPPPADGDTVPLTRSAYAALLDTVGSLPAESGAVIGGTDGVISHVWFDRQAGSGRTYYQPSREGVEETVRRWQAEGVRFAGIVHSHTDGHPHLSPMDLRAGAAFLAANGLPHLLLGLFYGGKLSLYRLTVSPEDKPPVLTPLKTTVISVG